MEQLSRTAKIRNKINELFPTRPDMTESELSERAENINENWDSIMSEFYTSEELENAAGLVLGENAKSVREREEEKKSTKRKEEEREKLHYSLAQETCTGAKSVLGTDSICNSPELNQYPRGELFCKGTVEKPQKQDLVNKEILVDKQDLVPGAIYTDSVGNKLEIQYEAETDSRYVVYPPPRGREILVSMNRKDGLKPRDMYEPDRIAAPWADANKIKTSIPKKLLACRDDGKIPESMIKIYLQFYPGDGNCFKEFDKFCTYYDSHGKKRVRWNATWRKWILKAIEFSEAKR